MGQAAKPRAPSRAPFFFYARGLNSHGTRWILTSQGNTIIAKLLTFSKTRMLSIRATGLVRGVVLHVPELKKD